MDALILHRKTWMVCRWFDIDSNPIDEIKYKILLIFKS